VPSGTAGRRLPGPGRGAHTERRSWQMARCGPGGAAGVAPPRGAAARLPRARIDLPSRCRLLAARLRQGPSAARMAMMATDGPLDCSRNPYAAGRSRLDGPDGRTPLFFIGRGARPRRPALAARGGGRTVLDGPQARGAQWTRAGACARERGGAGAARGSPGDRASRRGGRTDAVGRRCVSSLAGQRGGLVWLLRTDLLLLAAAHGGRSRREHRPTR
jgi:hypothetical protein